LVLHRLFMACATAGAEIDRIHNSYVREKVIFF
jgi:hypothetical protein